MSHEGTLCGGGALNYFKIVKCALSLNNRGREGTDGWRTKRLEKNHAGALVPAIEEIRKSFDTGESSCSRITKPLGHAALHSPVSDPASLVPYQAAFDGYRQMIGRRATSEFDDLLRQGAPPAVFRAYLDAYYEGLRINVRGEFDRVLSIGKANAQALEANLVDWAKSQIQLLINGQVHSVERWIKEVCDTQAMPVMVLISALGSFIPDSTSLALPKRHGSLFRRYCASCLKLIRCGPHAATGEVARLSVIACPAR